MYKTIQKLHSWPSVDIFEIYIFSHLCLHGNNILRKKLFTMSKWAKFLYGTMCVVLGCKNYKQKGGEAMMGGQVEDDEGQWPIKQLYPVSFHR